jgi:hypothetical protein
MLRWSSTLAGLIVVLLHASTAPRAFDFSVDPNSPEVPSPFKPGDLVPQNGASPAHIPAAQIGLSGTDNVDAFSYGRDRIVPLGPSFFVSLSYSVDRGTAGALRDVVANQVAGNGAAGDKFFVKLRRFPPVGVVPIVGPFLMSDAVSHNLTPRPDESDLDGLSQPAGTPMPVFFSVDRNGAPSLSGLGTVEPANVYYVAQPGTTAPTLYATPANLGLASGDNIDALAVLDAGQAGVLDAGDIVYVSLDRTSPARIALFGVSGGDGVLQVFPRPLGIQIIAAPGTLALDTAATEELNALTGFDPPPLDDCEEEDEFRWFPIKPAPFDTPPAIQELPNGSLMLACNDGEKLVTEEITPSPSGCFQMGDPMEAFGPGDAGTEGLFPFFEPAAFGEGKWGILAEFPSFGEGLLCVDTSVEPPGTSQIARDGDGIPDTLETISFFGSFSGLTHEGREYVDYQAFDGVFFDPWGVVDDRPVGGTFGTGSLWIAPGSPVGDQLVADFLDSHMGLAPSGFVNGPAANGGSDVVLSIASGLVQDDPCAPFEPAILGTVVSPGSAAPTASPRAIPSSILELIDGNTPTPDGLATFTFYGFTPVIGDGLIAFLGNDTLGRLGIYLLDLSDGTITKIVDTDTPMPGIVPPPGSDGTFSFFIDSLSLHEGNIAFAGGDALGTFGLYTTVGGRPRKVIGTGDVLDGRAVSQAFISKDALVRNLIGFTALFDSGGTSGVYVMGIPLPFDINDPTERDILIDFEISPDLTVVGSDPTSRFMSDAFMTLPRGRWTSDGTTGTIRVAGGNFEDLISTLFASEGLVPVSGSFSDLVITVDLATGNASDPVTGTLDPSGSFPGAFLLDLNTTGGPYASAIGPIPGTTTGFDLALGSPLFCTDAFSPLGGSACGLGEAGSAADIPASPYDPETGLIHMTGPVSLGNGAAVLFSVLGDQRWYEGTGTSGPPVPTDSDADGIPDSAGLPCATGQTLGCSDNCRFEPNNAGDDVQRDTDDNGRGDSCECGNADRSTTLDIFDALHIAQGTLSPPLVTLIHPRGCDSDGTGFCDIFDALRVAQATLSPPIAEIVQECDAATVAP